MGGVCQFMPLGALSILTNSISEHQEYLNSCKMWKSNVHHLILESLQEMINSLYQVPVLEEGPESSQEGKPACGWLSPCPTNYSKCPSWRPPGLWAEVQGAEASLALDPASLAFQPCGDRADLL